MQSFMYVFSIKFQNNITQVTYKRFFPSVFYQVCSKCTSAGKMLVTLLTFKWLFARVHHIITLQEKNSLYVGILMYISRILFPIRLLTLLTFKAFFVCELDTKLSTGLSSGNPFHIGCISMVSR